MRGDVADDTYVEEVMSMNNNNILSWAAAVAAMMCAEMALGALPPHVGLAAAHYAVSALTIDMRGGVNDKISVFPF